MKKLDTELTLSISAIITAIVAVWIAVVEQQSNREYQRLSVEPYVELSRSTNDGFKFILVNTGLGPARVKTVEVLIDDKRVGNWGSAVHLLTGVASSRLIVSDIWDGRQIKSGQNIELMHLEDPETIDLLINSSATLNMKICYCSMYRECWIKEMGKIPTQITQCPADAPKSFPF